MFHWGIEKFFNFGKSDDLIELALNLSSGHAENRPIEKNVFSPSQFGMKSGTDFEQARDAPLNPDPPASRFCNAAQYFQQSRFACAIAANDTDNFSASDVERNVPQSPEFFP